MSQISVVPEVEDAMEIRSERLRALLNQKPSPQSRRVADELPLELSLRIAEHLWSIDDVVISTKVIRREGCKMPDRVEPSHLIGPVLSGFPVRSSSAKLASC